MRFVSSLPRSTLEPSSVPPPVVPVGPCPAWKSCGTLEGSNVDLGSELTNLIETQRAYSSNAQVIKSATEMLDVVNHLSG